MCAAWHEISLSVVLPLSARAVRLWNDIMPVMWSQHDARFTLWVTRRNKWLAEACWSAWNVGWWKINLLCCPCFSWLWIHGKVNSVSRDLSSCLTTEEKYFYLTPCRCSHIPVSINTSKLPCYVFLASLDFMVFHGHDRYFEQSQKVVLWLTLS